MIKKHKGKNKGVQQAKDKRKAGISKIPTNMTRK